MTAPSVSHPVDATEAGASPGGGGWLTFAAALAVAGSYVRVFFFTPIELHQGAAQKIYYLHVPSAWVGMLAGLLVAATSVAYLWLRDPKLDRVAAAAAEIGLLFISVALITGPIWGKVEWGTYWQWWDLRLLLTLFYWFVLAGYVVMRQVIDDREMRARYSAVLGVLAALLEPFIHLSVYMVTTLHPKPIALRPTGPDMPFSMTATLLLSFGAFSLLGVALLRTRYELARLEDIREAVGHA